jgi:hypothetical protein
MTKTAIALMIAAALAVAANPAQARCAGHGKAKAQAAKVQPAQTAKKPAATVAPGTDVGAATTAEPSFLPAQAQLDAEFGARS